MREKKQTYQALLLSRLIWAGALFVLLVLIFCLKSYPDFVEEYYSQGLYPLIRRTFQFLFNYIPFSAGDMLYGVVIIALLIGVFKMIKLLIGRKFKSTGLLLVGFVIKAETAVIAFYLLWALNYFRQPAAERLNLPEFDYNQAQLVKITSMLIDSTNNGRLLLGPSEITQEHNDFEGPAVVAISDLSSLQPALNAIKPAVKSSLLSSVISYLGTAGYYNPYTGEAQFNNSMPVFTRPFVAVHEMAHQMGVGAEDEANFVAFIAGKASNNRLLKYSTYYLATQEFMNEVWRTDTLAFGQMKSRISPAVLRDFEAEQRYWIKYRGGAAQLSSIFYDNYLKANKQPGGLKTYNKMIRLSMAYYHKQGLIN